MNRHFFRFLFPIGLLLVATFIIIWLSTFHPADIQPENISCSPDAPNLTSGQTLKIYNQNVQYMAGKNYVFFYDLPNNAGPDNRPSSDDINATVQGIASLINQQNPDIILLQEIDDGAKRTDKKDQLKQLLALLPSDYLCHTSSFYWKATYVPHPRIMGSVGTKLSVISKYNMSSATRLQLSLIPQNPITQLFNFKRALLDVRLPIDTGGELAVLTTHLSAFSKGTNTLKKQINQIDQRLHALNKAQTPWIIAGDFNLLPPNTYSLLNEEQRHFHEEHSAIETLYQQYPAIPKLSSVHSEERENWYTYSPNGSPVKQPDRTIDYYFYSPQLSAHETFVEQNKALTLSDHMPIIASFTLPQKRLE
ncbi:MAG: endonuclease/exonuclease/phosphatase family protein [Cycloclasticus sp.]